MSDDAPNPAELLAKANVANITKKLKAGKTLTASERKALAEFEADKTGGAWVGGIKQLADELGLSRQALYDARKRFPDEAPKPDGRRENVEAWRAFCAEKLIGRDVATKTLAELKAEFHFVADADRILRDLLAVTGSHWVASVNRRSEHL